MEPKSFTLQAPLLIFLLSTLTASAQLDTPLPLKLDGANVELSASETAKYNYINKPKDQWSRLCKEVHKYPFEPLSNKGRGCPVFHGLQNSSDRFPLTKVTSDCQCDRQRHSAIVISTAAECSRARLPVTEWRHLRDSSGTVRLVMELVIRTVDCVTIMPRVTHAPSLSITGVKLRRKGGEVGHSLFEQVDCSMRYPWSQKIPRPTFGLRANPELRPQFQPIARCPCKGEAAVLLPIGILRLVANNTLTDYLEIVSVSCAILVVP